MRVYAIINWCEDSYLPDYRVFEGKVYPNRKDAQARMKALKTEQINSGSRWHPEEWSLIPFEVVEDKEVTVEKI